MKYLTIVIILMQIATIKAQELPPLTAEKFIGKHSATWHIPVGAVPPEIEFFKDETFIFLPYYVYNRKAQYEGALARTEIKGKWKFENKILYLVPTDNKLKTVEIEPIFKRIDGNYSLQQYLLNIFGTLGYSWAFDITGTWEVVYHLQEKSPKLVKHKEKYYSIESIQFLTDKTFIHKRTPPCGLDVFFTKKGTFEFVNNRLTLSYVGGEKYKDHSGGSSGCKGECITKKEQLVFNYTTKNTDTIELKNIQFEQQQEEAHRNKILQERKNNPFGFIRGNINSQKIWFNAYEITPLWLEQVKELVKKEPTAKPNTVARIKGVEYLSMNLFKSNNLEDTVLSNGYHPHYSTMLTLLSTEKDLSKCIKLSYEYSATDANSLGRLETCDKTIFENMQLKNGFLSGKIIGKMKYENYEFGYVEVNLEFILKLAECK